jgi:ribonuclease P protein component
MLQAAASPSEGDAAAVRIGFTASRKVGNAVVRNRAKRRLRAAAAEVLSRDGRPGTDYVLIARAGTGERRYVDLLGDLASALGQVDRQDGRSRQPGLTPAVGRPRAAPRMAAGARRGGSD